MRRKTGESVDMLEAVQPVFSSPELDRSKYTKWSRR